MLQAGYRLTPVALAASQVAPDRVNVPGLSNMAVLASQVLVKPNTLMGVCQPRSNPHSSCRWTVWQRVWTHHTGNTYERTLPQWFCLIFFVESGTHFSVSVTANGRGDLFLGGQPGGQKKQPYYQGGCHKNRPSVMLCRHGSFFSTSIVGFSDALAP